MVIDVGGGLVPFTPGWDASEMPHEHLEWI